MAKFCKFCGANFGEGDAFCPGCGAAADAQEIQQSQNQYAPPPQDQYAQPQGQYAPPPQGQYAQPQGQYAPQYDQYGQPMQNQYAPQQQAYVIPQLKLTKQHLLIIIIAIVAIVAVLLIINLTKDDDSKSRGGKSSGTVQNEDENDGETGVFEFSSLDDLPFGTMSINEIAEKYGTPNSASISSEEGDKVIPRLSYDNAAIAFSPMDASKFSSTGKTNGGEGEIELKSQDWDLQMEIMNVYIDGSGSAKIPDGLEFGKSTKDDVIAAYGNPGNELGGEGGAFTYLIYDHIFSGVDGQITFIFDSSGLLDSIMAKCY